MSTSAPPSAEQILNIAAVCHEANRMYCLTIGDTSQPDWMQAPEWQRSSAITGVEKIATGATTRPEQSHESWYAEKDANGWVYGDAKDAEAKTHPCMVPFAALSPEQQMKDKLFFAIASALLS
jgi:hypothetical protein